MRDMPPTVVFEGLPCCGKTSLGRIMHGMGIADLSDEVMLPNAVPTELGQTAALENDRLKGQFALARSRPVILDRYVYSTIAFEAACSTGPVTSKLIIDLARDLNIRDITQPHQLMIWHPQIVVSIDRARSDTKQERASEWHDPVFLSRFAEAYRVMFDHHVLILLGLPCQAVHWVTEAGAFPCATALLKPAYVRSA